MILKNQLQRLAKLRQFKGGDLNEWMTTEFRQNMLAIESAIRNLSLPPNYLSCQLSPLTIAHGTTAFFTFPFYLRTTNNNKQGDGGYLAKQTGNYLVNMNLANVVINGAKDVDCYIYKNGELLIGSAILRTDSTNLFVVPFSWIIELELNPEDVLTFGVANLGADTADVTVGYGFLEVQQITQG